MKNKLTSLAGFGEGDPKPEKIDYGFSKSTKAALKRRGFSEKHLAEYRDGGKPKHKALAKKTGKSKM